MASTFTSSLRLTKQGDGDNPNSWGVVLNDGVISLVDDAIAAYTTISIGSAATVTLSGGATFQMGANQALIFHKDKFEKVHASSANVHFTKIAYPRS